jgi:hypothetical protein
VTRRYLERSSLVGTGEHRRPGGVGDLGDLVGEAAIVESVLEGVAIEWGVAS